MDRTQKIFGSDLDSISRVQKTLDWIWIWQSPIQSNPLTPLGLEFENRDENVDDQLVNNARTEHSIEIENDRNVNIVDHNSIEVKIDFDDIQEKMDLWNFAIFLYI